MSNTETERQKFNREIAIELYGWRYYCPENYAHFFLSGVDIAKMPLSQTLNHTFKEPSEKYLKQRRSRGAAPEDIPDYVGSLTLAFEQIGKLIDAGHVFIVKGDGLRSGDHSPRWTVLCDNEPRVDGNDLPLLIYQKVMKIHKNGDGK